MITCTQEIVITAGTTEQHDRLHFIIEINNFRAFRNDDYVLI